MREVMRVKLYSVIMLAVVTFTACSNEEMGETETPRGLTLSASVENLSTRASMTDESGTWKFAFEANDQVSVSNSKITEDYTFKKTGEQFTCANAKATNEAADWYAYFPGNDVNLTGQDGTLNGVANYLAAAGKTTQATTGKDGLAITLSAKVAVLRIVEADKKGTLDICVKNTADGKWVTGLSAQKNQTTFDVKTSDTQTTLLSKENVKAGDFSYVVVPAGMGIQVYNGTVLISQTTSGLTAGKYYTITSVPTQGKSHATINDKDELVGWVQLWPGGPRFATKDVAETMTWTDAAKTGKDFAWGENWRTSTAEEITEVVKDSDGKTLFGGLLYDFHNSKAAEGSPSVKVEQKDVNNVEDDIVTFTGVYPGYTKTQLTLYNRRDQLGYNNFEFWTTSGDNSKGYSFRIMTQNEVIGYFGISKFETKDTRYLVRPVLAK